LKELYFLLKALKNSSMAGLRFNFQALSEGNGISQIVQFIISPFSGPSPAIGICLFIPFPGFFASFLVVKASLHGLPQNSLSRQDFNSC